MPAVSKTIIVIRVKWASREKLVKHSLIQAHRFIDQVLRRRLLRSIHVHEQSAHLIGRHRKTLIAHPSANRSHAVTVLATLDYSTGERIPGLTDITARERVKAAHCSHDRS